MPLVVVMTTGLAALAAVTSLPPTVTPAMPASAETLTEPVTVSPVPSTTLLWASADVAVGIFRRDDGRTVGLAVDGDGQLRRGDVAIGIGDV
jgi:hypothetical protein